MARTRRSVRGLALLAAVFAPAVVLAGGGHAAGLGTPPSNTTPPTIAGTPAVSQTLTASPGTWSGDQPISYAYQWQRCGYAAVVRQDGPAGYWRLGETAGPALDDVSFTDGTYSGGVTRGVAGALTGDTNKAATFNGTSGKVTVNPPLQLDTADFTLEAWFKTTAATPHQNIWIQSAPVLDNATTALKVQSGRLHWYNHDAQGTIADLDSGTLQNNGAWHHAVGVRQGNNWSLYLNGTRVAFITSSVGDVDHPDGISLIAGSRSTSFLNGSLDEVAVYRRALTATQVQAHYTARTSAPCTNIAGATGSSYTLVGGDLGSRLKVVVTATNASGSASAASSQSADATGSKPVNTAPPTIVGTPMVGEPVTASPGVWSGDQPISHTYRWERCGYARFVLQDGAVGYWRLAETAGDTAVNLAGTNNGTYSGGVTRGVAGALADDPNQAATFDGTSGKVTVNPPFQLDTADFTLEAWFKTTAATPHQNIWIQSAPVVDNATTALKVQSGRLHWYNHDAQGTIADLDSGTLQNNGLWHHAVGVRQGNNWSLYLNGTRVATITSSVGDVDHPNGISLIGGSQGTSYFNGSLDEVAVYRRALTLTQIKTHYDAGRVLRCVAIPGATSSTYEVQPPDGGSRLRAFVSATNAVGVAEAASSLTAETLGDIFHAWAYTDDPAAGGELIAEEWARLRGRTARHESIDITATRITEACDSNDPLGPRCAEVRIRTKGEDSDSYGIYRGRDSDPSVPQVASIVDPRHAFEGTAPDARGPISDAVRSWQQLPPIHGLQYERYDRSEAEHDERTSIWIDELTRMPLKQEVRTMSGELDHTRYWTYDQQIRLDPQLPSDHFRVPRPSNTGYDEELTWRGNDPVGTQQDIETGAPFRPFFLGVAPSIILDGVTSFYCLTDTGVVKQTTSDPREVTEETDASIEPDPYGPETWVNAEYIRVTSPEVCVPGLGTEKDEELAVATMAKGSSMAAGFRNMYVAAAQQIESDPDDPDRVRAGVVPITILGQPATAYVIPLNPDEVTALAETDDTTLLITGCFNRTSILEVASQLAHR